MMQVVSHHWGDQLWQMDCQPDIVTGGDLLYEPDSYDQLLGTLEDLAGPHTLVYLSFRSRCTLSFFHPCQSIVLVYKPSAVLMLCTSIS